MWKYQQPDFASFLLGELQKQQQGSIFCDTLLQTEGVCVPAHSCVLAALSPIFSAVLSTSPAPPAGKNRLLSLKAVGSHALLKLVGFVYTGEMKIESQSEHEDVMAAAHKLGLRNLIGKKRVWVERRVEDVGRYQKEAGVQTEENVKVKKSVSVPLPLGGQSSTFYNANNSGAPVSPMLDLSFDKHSPTRKLNVTVPSLTDTTEASISNQHKTNAKQRCKIRDGKLKSPTLQLNQMKLLNVEGTEPIRDGVMERSRNVSGKDFRKLLEDVTLQKNANAEQKETKVDQFNIKVKLRRRGTCWDSRLLVSVEGESESDEVKEFGPSALGCPSGVLLGQSLGTLTPPMDLPVLPSISSTGLSSDKQCLHPPNHSSVSALLDLPTLSSSAPQAEESDEQIAMLLEDMFMMGLNILPLMPLDRNLDEHQLNQLDPLQEQTGGTESSALNSSCFLQGFEPENRESGFSETATSVRFKRQRRGELEYSSFQKQERLQTLEPSTQSAGQGLHASLSHINKDTNLKTVPGDSVAPLVEDLLLTTKATPDPECHLSETDEMSDFDVTTAGFKLRCLSPLDDSDVPAQEPSGPSQHKTTNDLHAEQTNIIPELPKQRRTRRRKATQRLRRNATRKCQKLPNESQAQSRLSKNKSDYMVVETNYENIKPTTSNSRGADTQMTSNANQKTVTGVKRRREMSLPVCKKMTRSATSKQCEHEDDVPKAQVTMGPVKRGRGRPPKKRKIMQTCNDVNKLEKPSTSMPACLNQGDCEVYTIKTANVLKEVDKQESNTQKKNSTEIGKADVNSNFELTKQNSTKKIPSITDQVFHQTCPSDSSLPIGQRLTSNTQDGDSESNFGENEMGIFVLINDKDDKEKMDATDNQVRLQMSHSNMPDTVKCSVKENERPAIKKNSRNQCDFQNEMEKNIRDQPTKLYVNPLESEDIMIILMDGDVNHAMSPTETDNTAITNEPTVMERNNQKTIVHTSVCKNSNGTEAGNLENINLEAAVFNELSSVVTRHRDEDFQTCDDNYLEYNENLGRCKVVQLVKETIEDEETEGQRTNDEIVMENAVKDGRESCVIGVEGDKYTPEMINTQTLLEEEDLSTVHIANAKTTGDSPNSESSARVISRNASSVRTHDEVSNRSNSHISEDHSTVQTTLASSVLKDDNYLDEEEIEVDVLDDPEDASLLPFAAGQIITLPIENLQDQDVEMSVTEEEEVDVTGEETD
nr:uncharacterized protein LOC129444287 isoform X2 [Misgurnus anguillicaudatus]XP_055060845.1 uncharacterized protein LOC129444287 isoform X2 [Misgurnus anguillicaudatus]